MKILFVTPDINWPLDHGAGIRKWNILQGLLSVSEVDVLIFGGGQDSASSEAYAGCDKKFNFSRDLMAETLDQKELFRSDFRRLLFSVTSNVPQSFIKGDLPSGRQMYSKIVSSNEYSLIWTETLLCAKFFDIANFSSNIARVLDGDDFSWKRDLQVLRNTRFYGAKFLEYIDVLKMWYVERRCAKDFSYVVRCSVEDARAQGASNVVVIPNGANVPKNTIRKPCERLLFVGLLNYPPNRIGVEWLLYEVWPKIFSKVATAELDIVGKDPSEKIRSMHGKCGVRVHGFVKDLNRFYECASASVVPLHAGGGTRLKILESLGRGVPVISTTIGAFGIPLSEECGLIRKDGVTEFSEQCVEVLQNKNHGIQGAAMKGRDAVAEKFDWKIIQRVVSKIVEEGAF